MAQVNMMVCAMLASIIASINGQGPPPQPPTCYCFPAATGLLGNNSGIAYPCYTAGL